MRPSKTFWIGYLFSFGVIYEVVKAIFGNPDFERKNVSDYTIRRIIADKTGKSIVFEIEKRIEDEKGTSFRYMVETFILDN